tara:strand:+ start:240 stop:866 length:627 start_codon:yes stop_codon:yes gene_type:complete
MKLIKESCVETYDEAINAENRGADRIELCSRLDLDGLTPSKELVKTLVNDLTIPIKVMVRPRSGDFCYNDEEIIQMHNDILDFKTLGVFGVVFGVLRHDKSVNINIVNDLISASNGMNITFHKAIDEAVDVLDAYRNLISYTKISSVLTSGGSKSAVLGYKILRKMLKIKSDRVKIIIAGSITYENLPEVHDLIGGVEYHGRRIIDIS